MADVPGLSSILGPLANAHNSLPCAKSLARALNIESSSQHTHKTCARDVSSCRLGLVSKLRTDQQRKKTESTPVKHK